MVISAFTGFYTGVADSVLSNYFKEAYDATATQRGFIEIPRELPGVLALFVITAFSFLRDIKTAIISQVFGIIGMLALGIFHPSFAIMLLFVFIFSMGQHMNIPLFDSIGLSLATRENMGRVLSGFKSVNTAFVMISGIVCFFGFRFGFFHFNIPVTIFLICAGCFVVIAVLLAAMHGQIGKEIESRTEQGKMIFRKEYTRYYVISAIFGARKQIMFAFSPWVLIELLGFKADIMSILGVIGAFIGIFFIRAIGKWIDGMGARKVMLIEALCFIVMYIVYGMLSKWVNENVVILTGLGMLLIYALYIIDRMTLQFYMVRAIYMKSIAVKEEDVTPSLSAGMAIDHVLSIVCALICGVIWDKAGPEYVFVFAAALSAANFAAVWGIKKDNVIDRV